MPKWLLCHMEKTQGQAGQRAEDCSCCVGRDDAVGELLEAEMRKRETGCSWQGTELCAET